MNDQPSGPRRSVRVREEDAAQAAEEVERKRAERMAEGERRSLEDPDRPAVAEPTAEWPDEIHVRLVYGHGSGAIIVEIPDGFETSWGLPSQEGMTDPGLAMAGAEVALAALGYRLDRYRLYDDGGLMVGKFHRMEK